MAIDLAKNYFELFSLPVDFDIDPAELGERYRALQQDVHPDRFAAADARAQRISVQSTTHLNEAYETLKDPLRRGFYMLKLRGAGSDTHEYTTSDGAFLMRQLEHREALEEIPRKDDPFEALDALRDTIDAEEREQMAAFRRAWDAGDYEAANDALTKVMFIRRLQQQIDETEERLEDELD